jgi:hypothetical protein
MLSVLLAGLRQSGMLGGAVPPGKIADFQSVAQKLYLAGKSVATIKKIGLNVTKAPLTLATTPSAGSISHGQTELGAVLTVECPKRRFEWTLALRAPVQVVIGSARTSTTETIHIFTSIDQPLDVLFDLAQTTVTVQKLTVTEQETQTLPGTIELDPKGKPIHTGGETEVVDLPPVSIDLKDPKLDVKAHAAFALKVVGLLLERRDARHAPHRDGAPKGKPDSLALQRYPLDGKDPDLDGGQLYVRADLSFDEGGLLLHGFLAGTTASFDDTHHISSTSMVRSMGVIAARLIYPPLDE